MYDTETGFYYLKSRYYDPAVCRFISSDVFLSTGQGVLGNNSYAYCNNNAIHCADSNGHAAHFNNVMYVMADVIAVIRLSKPIQPVKKLISRKF